jgi:sugar O-acyltransferase (sialic acid O-acetyltransferase NeuD family)
MLPRWYLYGAGGLGLETMDILADAMRAGRVAPHEGWFIEDGAARKEVNGFPVCDIADCIPGSKVTIAVGEPLVRQKLMEKAEAAGLELASLISPAAFVSSLAHIEAGVIVAPLCSIQARARVEKNVGVNTMAIIGHDVVVRAGAVISSMVNLGGAVQVGPLTYIGMGALIREKLTIGERTIIGMGSVVHADMPDGVIALGNPARVSRRNESHKVFN